MAKGTDHSILVAIWITPWFQEFLNDFLNIALISNIGGVVPWQRQALFECSYVILAFARQFLKKSLRKWRKFEPLLRLCNSRSRNLFILVNTRN